MMTKEKLYSTLVEELKKIIAENGLETSEIRILSSGLTPEEAIGITERKDYPILDGKEIMLQAEFDGAIGQAFTSSPASYVGTLDEILNADLENDDQARALFIAAMKLNMLNILPGNTEVQRSVSSVISRRFCRSFVNTLLSGRWI